MMIDLMCSMFPAETPETLTLATKMKTDEFGSAFMKTMILLPVSLFFKRLRYGHKTGTLSPLGLPDFLAFHKPTFGDECRSCWVGREFEIETLLNTQSRCVKLAAGGAGAAKSASHSPKLR